MPKKKLEDVVPPDQQVILAEIGKYLLGKMYRKYTQDEVDRMGKMSETNRRKFIEDHEN